MFATVCRPPRVCQRSREVLQTPVIARTVLGLSLVARTHISSGPRKEMFGWKRSGGWSSTSRRRGNRRVSSSSASCASSLPSADPMQKWMPLPNARWRFAFGRVGSKRSGSSKTPGRGRRGEPQEQRRALGDLDAAERHRALRAPPPERHRRVVAQRLLDDARDERRVGDDRVPARGLLEQPADHVADEVVRRLVAGEAQREQDRRDLLLRERVGILVVDGEQRAREVVGAVGRLRATSSRRYAR